MPRSIRYLPHPGTVVEITQRTIQGRFLLKPSPRVNALVAGCLARAQKITGARVHAVAVLSNHFHLLATFDTVEQMAKFVCYFKTNVSKEVGRLHNWQGPMFAGRYQAIPLSDEPEVQQHRLRYILSQGAKEGLVMSPKDWPGIHCAEALASGHSIRGIWVDRTALYSSRQKGERVCAADVTSEEVLRLEPLPALASLDTEAHSSMVRELIRSIELEALAMHRTHQTVPVGAAAICRRHPFARPNSMPRPFKPYFHATKSVLHNLMQTFREFMEAYRAAAKRLAAGDPRAVFPENCYPPRLPFVEPMPRQPL